MGALGDDMDFAVRHQKAMVALEKIISKVTTEIDHAFRKFPTWPNDPPHALAVLGEEYGELNKAVLQATYEPEKSNPDNVREQAIQTAAMALRFLISLDRYEYQEGEQHPQVKL